MTIMTLTVNRGRQNREDMSQSLHKQEQDNRLMRTRLEDELTVYCLLFSLKMEWLCLFYVNFKSSFIMGCWIQHLLS